MLIIEGVGVVVACFCGRCCVEAEAEAAAAHVTPGWPGRPPRCLHRRITQPHTHCCCSTQRWISNQSSTTDTRIDAFARRGSWIPKRTQILLSTRSTTQSRVTNHTGRCRACYIATFASWPRIHSRTIGNCTRWPKSTEIERGGAKESRTRSTRFSCTT